MKMARVTVIDYGMGNLASLVHALEVLGAEVQVVSHPDPVAHADRIILPGVGAFRPAMERLADRQLLDALEVARSRGVPILGICLGMQLLFAESEEGSRSPGLGWISGKVVRFRDVPKIPHMGWNQLEIVANSTLLEGVPGGTFVYFVHSYHCVPERSDTAIAYSDYGNRFCAAVHSGNLFGVQFHPEKSQRYGLRILGNFLKMRVNHGDCSGD